MNINNSFDSFTVTQLKNIIRTFKAHHSIKAYSKLKRDQLINALNDHFTINNGNLFVKQINMKIPDKIAPKKVKKAPKKAIPKKEKEIIFKPQNNLKRLKQMSHIHILGKPKMQNTLSQIKTSQFIEDALKETKKVREYIEEVKKMENKQDLDVATKQMRHFNDEYDNINHAFHTYDMKIGNDDERYIEGEKEAKQELNTFYKNIEKLHQSIGIQLNKIKAGDFNKTGVLVRYQNFIDSELIILKKNENEYEQLQSMMEKFIPLNKQKKEVKLMYLEFEKQSEDLKQRVTTHFKDNFDKNKKLIPTKAEAKIIYDMLQKRLNTVQRIKFINKLKDKARESEYIMEEIYAMMYLPLKKEWEKCHDILNAK